MAEEKKTNPTPEVAEAMPGKPQEATREKSKIAEKEEEILRFWQENKIFDKSLQKPAPNGDFVFYDGPPFATGLPHYGHILPGTIKDVIPRYQTMKGKRVFRKWGWDCHGLPVENLVEKELGLSSKKDIEKFGVEKFNAAARNTVMRYADEWKKIIPRVGRWVDMENDYKTMDTYYTESVWWAFKNLYEKDLVYKNFKVMYLCPHCETPLANFEVNQGYKDITDISVYVKFTVVGEENTYFLAWTTTPWTLPGNVALAVNKNATYVKVKEMYPEKSAVELENNKNPSPDKMVEEYYILEKESFERLKKYFKNPKIMEKFSGKKLLGKSYKTLFPYYDNDELENGENGFKVYHGDFVTTTDGTGIVHIAPAFGEDDLNLGNKEKLPFIQHVAVDGTFKKEVTDFVGQKVKPKDDHQRADVEVIKFLAKAGTLFEKEKIIHSYPHCWRCDTPLLNYATTSWFIKVTDLKDKLLKINSNISWNPPEIGEGRFGKWLEGARDWAISRSRYWGAPLPVWENDKKERTVIGSIAELKSKIPKRNNYFLLRHGESISNTKGEISATASVQDLLTENGKGQVLKAAELLKKEKIDAIITSPFVRAKQTAEIIAKEIGFKGEIMENELMGEMRAEEWNGRQWSEYQTQFNDIKGRFERHVGVAENWEDMRKRVSEFMSEIDAKYENKNILVVGHGGPLTLTVYASEGLSVKEIIACKQDGVFENAEIKEIDWRNLPHNKNYELDLHRPFIDEIKLVDKDGTALKRVPEVFDCWLESGSMSFAQYHYPFENKAEFESKNSSIFPADFIAEGLDQTRGWFYTMLILGTGLFEKSPYERVVVNGMVLAEDGRKMSKSLNNYPDIMYIVDKYGADSLRYYLMSSPAVKSEDLNFSEKGVDEISKKIILKLENVISFYEMYAGQKVETRSVATSGHILDKWILIRLNELGQNMTASLDTYRIDSAARPILSFIDDLSVWYIRRSRDRFKSEDVSDRNNALSTTHFVLLQLAKYMAPFTPFFAESLYLKLRSDGDPESVHLCDWPQAGEVDDEILENMNETRKVVSLALEKRMAANIKVRQPLQKIQISKSRFQNLGEQYLELIKDELNVKNVVFGENLEGEVELDTEITVELQKEGNARDFIRAVQDLRKNKNLVPSESVELSVETDDKGREFLNSTASEIKKPTNISEFLFEENDGEEIKINPSIEGLKFKIKIK